MTNKFTPVIAHFANHTWIHPDIDNIVKANSVLEDNNHYQDNVVRIMFTYENRRIDIIAVTTDDFYKRIYDLVHSDFQYIFDYIVEGKWTQNILTTEFFGEIENQSDIKIAITGDVGIEYDTYWSWNT